MLVSKTHDMKDKYIRLYLLLSLIFLQNIAFGQDETIDELTYNSSKELASSGWNLIAEEKFDHAINLFNQSIELFDGNTDAFVGRSTAYMRLDLLDHAEKDLEKALTLSPNQSDMFYLAGNIFFKMKYYFRATENYSKALRHNSESDIPVDPLNCYYNRANAYFAAEMYRSAINDYSKVIALDEEYMHAYHNRALAYKHREDFENACLDFDKAKELGSQMSDKFIDKYCK